MVKLGKSQHPVIMSHYPHMLAEDTEIWTSYLSDPTDEILEVWYDVHLGQNMLLDENASEMDKRIADGISRKRVDVVCRVQGGYWVVEIKPLASMYALGQVLSYTRLFSQEYIYSGFLHPVVICKVLDEDLRDDFELSGVIVITV